MHDADAPVNCENCATPLEGAYCHACGQHAANPLRSFSHALEELFESFWHLDGRAFRTFRDLFVPGRVACNYLAGQRARYIPPLRLFLVLTVVTFFVGQFVVNAGTNASTEKAVAKVEAAHGESGDASNFDNAKTPAEVIAVRDKGIAAIEAGRDGAALVPAVGMVLDKAEQELRANADERLAQLGAGPAPKPGLASARAPSASSPASKANPATRTSKPDATRASASSAGATTGNGTKPVQATDETASATPAKAANSASPKNDEDSGIHIGAGALRNPDKEWDEHENPVDVSWLPDIGDRWINHRLANAKRNVGGEVDGRNVGRIFALALAAVPSALFVLVPVFALLLKLLYIGTRRSYLEHLVVALYSHAFMLSMLLFAFLVGILKLWQPAGALGTAVGIAQVGFLVATPVYLFKMQSRVYGQRRVITMTKYLALGFAYSILMAAAVVYSVFAGITSSG